jgi:hypothetical protein
MGKINASIQDLKSTLLTQQLPVIHFTGALATALTKGKSIDEAVDFANIVGSLTVMKKGFFCSALSTILYKYWKCQPCVFYVFSLQYV